MQDRPIGSLVEDRYHECRINVVSRDGLEITAELRSSDTAPPDTMRLKIDCPVGISGDDWMAMWANRIQLLGHQIGLSILLGEDGTPTAIKLGYYRCRVTSAVRVTESPPTP